MSGTKEGGRKTREANYKKYGPNFYREIGAKGGKLGRSGGFASNFVGPDGLTGRERARIAGAKGGTISRRWTVVDHEPFSKGFHKPSLLDRLRSLI